jgi:hypothetical protein
MAKMNKTNRIAASTPPITPPTTPPMTPLRLLSDVVLAPASVSVVVEPEAVPVSVTVTETPPLMPVTGVSTRVIVLLPETNTVVDLETELWWDVEDPGETEDGAGVVDVPLVVVDVGVEV